MLVGGEKLPGVLCETRWQGSSPDLVVGFGVNVLQREFPAELRATVLRVETSSRGSAEPWRYRLAVRFADPEAAAKFLAAEAKEP